MAKDHPADANPPKRDQRGSEKVLAAWKARALTEESVNAIAQGFEKSPAKVEQASALGGTSATGLRLSLRYDGDDGPWCGNDILFWLRWHMKYGGAPRPPKIIINGTPFPDLVRMELDFGHVGTEAADIVELPGGFSIGDIGG